jgi:DNA-binding LytR/AlgR family response regulator
MNFMSDSKPLRCLIVDDEPQAREVIKRYIEQVPLLKLSGECANALEALALLQQQSYDLLFLDIHMPQLKGVDLIKILKTPPKIILTTAHIEYALEGYELDVVDFLLKPIRFDRFLKAVQKIIHVTSTIQEPHFKTPQSLSKPFVYFRIDRKMVKVDLDAILYVESMKDYIKIVTPTGVLITKQSISSVEALLPENKFIRIHRSFLVSVNHIQSYTTELIQINEAEIPIGKLYREAVHLVLEQQNNL